MSATRKYLCENASCRVVTVTCPSCHATFGPSVYRSSHGTVGGLLATMPADLSGMPGARWTHTIEWLDSGTWFRIAPGESEIGEPTLILATWRDGGWHYEDENPMSIDVCVYALPARLVPSDLADLDPATRGPLPKE